MTTIEKSYGAMEFERRLSDEAKLNKGEGILSINSTPRNIRGKSSEGNWAVDYEVSTTLGKTGKQTNSKYFYRKEEAQSWIDKVRENKEMLLDMVDKANTEIAKIA